MTSQNDALNTQNTAGQLPSVVTYERIAAFFTAQEWQYELRTEPTGNARIVTGFGDSMVIISISDENLALTISVFGNNAMLASSHLEQVQQWANAWNTQTLIGTVVPLTQEDQVLVKVNVAFSALAGFTDVQLQDDIEIGINVGLDAIAKFVQDFSEELAENSN